MMKPQIRNPSALPLNSDLTAVISQQCDIKSLNNLAKTNKTFANSVKSEVEKRVKNYATNNVIYHHIILKNLLVNPKFVEVLLQQSSYVTLIKVGFGLNNIDKIQYEISDQSRTLKALEEKAQDEITKRDLEIKDFLPVANIDHILQKIYQNLNQQDEPHDFRVADSLIGKYLYKVTGRTNSPESNQEWQEIINLLKARDEKGNSLLHVAATKNDPQLMFTVIKCYEKAFLDVKERFPYYMLQNNDGDNPFHVAFNYNNYSSLTALDNAAQRLTLDDYMKPIYNQKNKDDQTVADILEIAKIKSFKSQAQSIARF